MNPLYLQLETSIPPHTIISVRGDGTLSRETYDKYLYTFIKNNSNVYVSKDETVILYPYNNDISEYCTIVKLLIKNI